MMSYVKLRALIPYSAGRLTIRPAMKFKNGAKAMFATLYPKDCYDY